ncbi:zinc finger CDGSH type [Necator americanus]|uniref:Zinc finger CDGSH type n=1 Tax=Necator americanus TaxID=51031 RepID=W2TD94_NECAM|nr:zinc finger CDGSH type [Necator americanus]ETN80020.1 zinc finger CDGSH type [Necator americanus]
MPKLHAESQTDVWQYTSGFAIAFWWLWTGDRQQRKLEDASVVVPPQSRPTYVEAAKCIDSEDILSRIATTGSKYGAMHRSVLSRFSAPQYVHVVRFKAKGVAITNPSADFLPYKGVPATNKPIKVNLESGKTYSWCACGLSRTQPFCDGTHRNEGLTTVRPVRFQVEKTGDYIMCNCKQTESRPICDGYHKQVSGAPKDLHATRFVTFGDNSPVYDGVARKLGYKPKNGGFQ